MKNSILLILFFVMALSTHSSCQIWNDVKKSVEKEISGSGSLTEEEVGKGLKEALTKGIKTGVERVSKPDGYFKDPVIKILMPPEAKVVEEKLRALGQDKLVDDAIESMNRAAEDAAEGAINIFVDAIKKMTIQDAMSLLKGEDDAATRYLERNTRSSLTEKFEPVIKASLDKVGATKHWNTVMSTYNKVPFTQDVNPNLEEYVTDKAIDGLFVQVAKEEKEIRENPVARTTELLKKVFAES